MLMHVAIAVEQRELASRLSTLLARKDTVLERAKNPGLFWKDIARKTFDLFVVSREFMDERALRKVEGLRELPDGPAIVVLSEDENDEDRANLIAKGCEVVLNPGLPARKLGAALNAVLDRRRDAVVGSLSIPRRPTHTEISDFVAKSPAMRSFIKLVPRIARSDASVLILGETGVGKERLAHVLHTEGRRAEGPFVAVHCGALPESLLESELFGHEQGAFTGAIRARRGCFELAHQGTIFLDEIGEMPLHLQSKLLRVLEDHEIRRIGSERSAPVDVRVMAATNRDLEEEIRGKRFRRDLYYRLNVVSLTIPPLRERLEDIPELVDSYIEYLGPRIGCDVSGITQGAMDAMSGYSWPGNVRELINVIERAMLLCEGDEITCEDLPQSITETVESSVTQSASGTGMCPDQLYAEPLRDARKQILDQFEREYLVRLLRATGGRVGKAAAKAKIDSRTLFDKMKRYGLNKQDFRS